MKGVHRRTAGGYRNKGQVWSEAEEVRDAEKVLRKTYYRTGVREAVKIRVVGQISLGLFSYPRYIHSILQITTECFSRTPLPKEAE